MRLFYNWENDCIETETTLKEDFEEFETDHYSDFEEYIECCKTYNNGILTEIHSIEGIFPGMNLEESDIYYDDRHNRIVTRSILETEYNALSSVFEDIDCFSEWIGYNGIILLDSFDLMMKSEDIFEFIEEF